jgi:hypothetical protein
MASGSSNIISNNQVVLGNQVLKCKLLEYAVLYSGKSLWGLDCDLEQLQIELEKIYRYLYLLNSLEQTNNCDHIPTSMQEKINNYIKALSRKRSTFCKNC